jgi:cytochrome c6
MSDAKTPKVLLLLLILALAGAIVVSGCGGGGSSSSSATTAEGASSNEEEAAEEKSEEGGGEAEPEEEEEMSEAEARSGEGSLAAEGKTVFSANCGSCHTLKAAGTSGEIGPNLDELEPDLATVEHQVVNGGGGMPAFGKEGALNAKEIKAVATYVSSVAGQG